MNFLMKRYKCLMKRYDILMLSEPSLALKKCSGVTTVFDTHLFLEVIKLNALGRLDNVPISTHMIYFQKLISLL